MIIKDIKILDEYFEIKEHMNLVVEDEVIKYIGEEIDEQSDETVIDGRNKFLMPAFYNTHCHVPMTLLRGYGEGLPLQRWLQEKIFPFEAKFKAEYKYWGAKLGAIELMKSGCVSISDMYFDLVDYGKALYEGGMKANLSNGLVTFDESASYYDDSSYRDTVRLQEWIRELPNDRIKADASIHSEYATKEKAVREVGEFAKANNMIIQAHVSETQQEHQECIERHGLTPIQYMEKCGLLNNQLVGAHCVWLSDEDVDIMNEHGAFISHNASSNLKLGSGIAPIKDYFNRGLNLTLGTDGASSNNNLNALEELHMAAMLCRGISLDANAITAKDMIKIATRNGALAQGRTDCGLIKEGYKADFLIFDLDREHFVPDYDTLANVVFGAGADDIYMTVCDGRIISKEGVSCLIDEEETRAKARESFKNVLKSI